MWTGRWLGTCVLFCLSLFQRGIRSKLATFIVVNSIAKANVPLLGSCYQLSPLCCLGVFRHLGGICSWLCFNLSKTWVSYPIFLTCQEFIQAVRWLVGNRQSAPTFAVRCANKAAQRSKILRGSKMSRAGWKLYSERPALCKGESPPHPCEDMLLNAPSCNYSICGRKTWEEHT